MSNRLEDNLTGAFINNRYCRINNIVSMPNCIIALPSGLNKIIVANNDGQVLDLLGMQTDTKEAIESGNKKLISQLLDLNVQEYTEIGDSLLDFSKGGVIYLTELGILYEKRKDIVTFLEITTKSSELINGMVKVNCRENSFTIAGKYKFENGLLHTMGGNSSSVYRGPVITVFTDHIEISSKVVDIHIYSSGFNSHTIIIDKERAVVRYRGKHIPARVHQNDINGVVVSSIRGSVVLVYKYSGPTIFEYDGVIKYYDDSGKFIKEKQKTSTDSYIDSEISILDKLLVMYGEVIK